MVSTSTFSEKMGAERKDREPIALKHLREGSQWLWRTVSVLGNKVTVLLGSSVS